MKILNAAYNTYEAMLKEKSMAELQEM